jgi:hypothetical protein
MFLNPVVQVQFVEKIFPFSLNYLGIFIKIQLTIYTCGFISRLCFVLMVYVSDFMPVPHCPDSRMIYSNPFLDLRTGLMQRPKTQILGSKLMLSTCVILKKSSDFSMP